VSFEPRSRKHDYRKSLTSDEARELEQIDREAAAIDSRRRMLSTMRRLIVDRALKRSVYKPARSHS